MGQCFGPADAATRGNAMTFFFHLGDSSTLCANYELMVHVAGHTLGLSGFSLLDLLSEERIYTIAHPKISDSVMSYDSETPVLNEPECSPHPFDILAINALYQKIGP